MQLGSYDVSAGCLPCGCNMGGSTSPECSTMSGQCPCKPNIEGRDCSRPALGFYAQSLDLVTLEAEDITVNSMHEHTSAVCNGVVFSFKVNNALFIC